MIDLIKLTRFLTTITESPKHEIDRVKIMIHYYLYVCFSLIFLEKKGWLVCNFFLVHISDAAQSPQAGGKVALKRGSPGGDVYVFLQCITYSRQLKLFFSSLNSQLT